MLQGLQEHKVLSTVLTVVVLIFVAVTFVVREQYLRNQSYKGVIEEVYRKRDWRRWLRQPYTRPDYYYYRYYWRIRDDMGGVRTVRVNRMLWQKGEAGTPVRKVSGERSPRINTAEAERHRQLTDDLFHEVTDNVRRHIWQEE